MQELIITEERLAKIILQVAQESFIAGSEWCAAEDIKQFSGEENFNPSLTEYTKNLDIKQLLNSIK